MPIFFECDQCRKRYELADALAGKRVRCKQCGFVGRAPAVAELAPVDLYALDDEPQAWAVADEPVAPSPGSLPKKPKKPKPASGLWWLSTWPAPAMHVYRGVMAVMLVALLFVGPVEKLVLAMVGSMLMIAPLIASVAVPQLMVPFREGLFVGLMCCCIPIYNIYFRLTRDDLYRKHRRPPLTRGDYSVILLGLLFLPFIVLAAREVDQMPRNPPQARNRVPFALRTAEVAVAARQPDRAEPEITPPDPPTPPRPKTRRRADPRPAEPQAAATPTEPSRSEPASSGNVYSYKPDAEPDSTATRPDPTPAAQSARRPRPSLVPRPAARSSFGPDQTVTITVTGLTDRSASDRINKAITALLKAAGKGLSLQSRTSGGKGTFIAAPVDDPRGFVDQLAIGRIIRVEGRSIEVDARP